jgi:putative redox protein
MRGADPMEVIVRHLSGTQFEARASGHRLLSDQPSNNPGTNLGMTPPEILLSALGTCAGYYAVEYLRARGFECPDLAVRVIAEKTTQPARLGSLWVEVTMPGLDPARKAGVVRAVKACLIHKTLSYPSAIEVSVSTAEPAVA